MDWHPKLLSDRSIPVCVHRTASPTLDNERTNDQSNRFRSQLTNAEANSQNNNTQLHLLDDNNDDDWANLQSIQRHYLSV
jgi:hypothetical protein